MAGLNQVAAPWLGTGPPVLRYVNAMLAAAVADRWAFASSFLASALSVTGAFGAVALAVGGVGKVRGTGAAPAITTAQGYRKIDFH